MIGTTLGSARSALSTLLSITLAACGRQAPVGANSTAQLLVLGGATHLRFDKHYEHLAGPELPWQTPGFDSATDRYEISVEGGASNLSVAS